jgi:predicted DNA-binding WGR domain protein
MRRFEYKDEKSHKFWDISFDATSITARWGRVGAKSQSRTKAVADPGTEAGTDGISIVAGALLKNWLVLNYPHHP